MLRELCCTSLLFACAPPPAVRVQAAQEPEPAARSHAEVARYHMRRHYDDVRTIERLLINGHLMAFAVAPVLAASGASGSIA
jgi:hypothetical protein